MIRIVRSRQRLFVNGREYLSISDLERRVIRLSPLVDRRIRRRVLAEALIPFSFSPSAASPLPQDQSRPWAWVSGCYQVHLHPWPWWSHPAAGG